MTIRAKLAIWLSLLVAIILVLLATVRYAGQKELLADQKDYSLKITAGILDASLPRGVPTEKGIQKTVVKMISNHPEIELKGIIIEVYDTKQHIIFSSTIAEGGLLPISPKSWRKAQLGETLLSSLSYRGNRSALRALLKPVFEEDRVAYFILLGSSMEDIDRALENFFLLNLIFIPLATLLLGGGVWLLTKKALKPVDLVIKTAHQISSGNRNQRIQISGTGKEVKDLAEAFNQMIQRLETSFQQIQEFSENVSHELRIPLTILRGEIELSLRRARSADDYQKILQSNLEETLRMEKIVGKLLFLSKADRGEIALEGGPVDFHPLVERVYHQFQRPAEEKNLTLHFKSEGSVPGHGDELLLREVLMNLIQNAINATPSGGEISLSLHKEKETIRILIEDTGCGIPEKDIPHIFNRFYKVDKSHSGQGSGLGLCICKWIVEAHRAVIMVESTSGKGSRFILAFPKPPFSES